ncbi:hypothetical protein BCR44DRAFT_1250064 [Catenaria anguillulae PL171]|uniref:Secreted protein n=1 Tax=Catenaria anguillulae PL171 TaxID=765915 RepID=A0A1Y2HY81_9FUNG|nr:hypothetical protein BCR44DRAFT_1250064 [Catenaria anguillulae PL171]
MLKCVWICTYLLKICVFLANAHALGQIDCGAASMPSCNHAPTAHSGSLDRSNHLHGLNLTSQYHIASNLPQCHSRSAPTITTTTNRTTRARKRKTSTMSTAGTAALVVGSLGRRLR